MDIKALKGFKDILPDEVGDWQQVEAVARNVFERFGFWEIKVPIIEKTELFARSIGEATDIVEKEMYTFADRNGEFVTLRPEGTASLLRAFIEHGLHVQRPLRRLFTIGPMFRHERPQMGRLRQFHQMSVEALGSGHPLLDAEVIAMAWQVMQELGVSVSLQINSLGCPACRPGYKQALTEFLDARQNMLCDDCRRRSVTNPLRVLDCKSQHCQEQYKEVPAIIDHLCAGCDEHFVAVRQALQGLDIAYEVNSFMVRGLDYYTRTTFELVTDALGAQSAVGAGGRYDGLVEQLGGPKNMPGIGFAIGMERLVLLLKQGGFAGRREETDIYVAALGEAAAGQVYPLIHHLRRKKLRAAMDLEGRSLKSQMKQADKLGARYVLILGDEELSRRQAMLRNMQSKEQFEVPILEDTSSWADVLAATVQSVSQ